MEYPKFLYIDGPEKAGKSTLARAIIQAWPNPSRVLYRHWGPVDPDDRVYAEYLQYDLASHHELIIWDRGWVAEHVYANLLGRDRRLRADPWLGEWLYGRAVLSAGKRVILTPWNSDFLANKRDATDLLVDPAAEMNAYIEYARRFKLQEYKNDYTARTLHQNTAKLIADLVSHPDTAISRSVYAGPVDARVVVVGEERGDDLRPIPGGWLPFSTPTGVALGRLLGDDALRLGWTTARYFPPQQLDRFELVIACGQHAAQWAKYHAGHRNVIDIPHPAFALAGKRATSGAQVIAQKITHDIREVLNNG